MYTRVPISQSLFYRIYLEGYKNKNSRFWQTDELSVDREQKGQCNFNWFEACIFYKIEELDRASQSLERSLKKMLEDKNEYASLREKYHQTLQDYLFLYRYFDLGDEFYMDKALRDLVIDLSQVIFLPGPLKISDFSYPEFEGFRAQASLKPFARRLFPSAAEQKEQPHGESDVVSDSKRRKKDSDDSTAATPPPTLS